jgi:hypothetical protein
VLEVERDPSPAPPRLHVAGAFTLAPGGVGANRIARYDSPGWSALGTGVTGGSVSGLRVFDEGAGAQLFACGLFSQAGGVATGKVARWNGTSWSSVGGGVTGVWAACMQVFDDGAGPALFVGGNLLSGGGSPVGDVLRWNGSAWSAWTFSPPMTVLALAVHDDGSGGGPALYAGTTDGVHRLDAGAWTHFASTPDDAVRSLASFDDGFGPALYAGGWFGEIGGVASANFGRYGSCVPGVAFCAGDGLDPDVTTPCPCANTGAPGRGCAWSNNPNGARLSGSGTPDPDTLVLTAEGMPASTLCIFLFGDDVEAGGVPFGDGVRCVGGTLLRMGIAQASAGVAQYPIAGQLPVSVRCGTPVGSGRIGRYQTYFRNAAAAFCPPELFNVTNGLRLRW